MNRGRDHIYGHKPFALVHSVSVSPAKGGAMCGICSKGVRPLIPVSVGTLKTLEMALKIEPDKIPRLVFREAKVESREFLHAFIRYHTGREMKSLEFLEKIKGV